MSFLLHRIQFHFLPNYIHFQRNIYGHIKYLILRLGILVELWVHCSSSYYDIQIGDLIDLTKLVWNQSTESLSLSLSGDKFLWNLTTTRMRRLWLKLWLENFPNLHSQRKQELLLCHCYLLFRLPSVWPNLTKF